MRGRRRERRIDAAGDERGVGAQRRARRARRDGGQRGLDRADVAGGAAGARADRACRARRRAPVSISGLPGSGTMLANGPPWSARSDSCGSRLVRSPGPESVHVSSSETLLPCEVTVPSQLLGAAGSVGLDVSNGEVARDHRCCAASGPRRRPEIRPVPRDVAHDRRVDVRDRAVGRAAVAVGGRVARGVVRDRRRAHRDGGRAVESAAVVGVSCRPSASARSARSSHRPRCRRPRSCPRCPVADDRAVAHDQRTAVLEDPDAAVVDLAAGDRHPLPVRLPPTSWSTRSARCRRSRSGSRPHR